MRNHPPALFRFAVCSSSPVGAPISIHKNKGVDHWAAFGDHALLFHPQKSELPLLDVSDGDLMAKIYKDNGSGWIKIAVVRDPVTRLLSAYLDFVLARRAGKSSDDNDHHDRQRHRSLLAENEELAWLDGVGKHRQQQGEEFKEKEDNLVIYGEGTGEGARRGEGQEKAGADVDSGGVSRKVTEEPPLDEEAGEGNRARAVAERGTHSVVVPTFPELVDILTRAMSIAPVAFKPMSGMCGIGQSPFDTVIPFETLQVCGAAF